MAGSGSRSTEQVKEQEKQTQREAKRLTPCCIPGKSREQCRGKGTVPLSSLPPWDMAPRPLSPAVTGSGDGFLLPMLMAILGDEGECDQPVHGQGLAGFEVLLGGLWQQWEMSYSVLI